MSHQSRRPQVHMVTQARRSLSDDIAYRQRRYLVMMSIRAICFVIAVVLFVNHFGWLAAVPAIAAIVIPYFAVVFANGGREPDNTRGFMEYRPNVPATRDPGAPGRANDGNGQRPVEPGPGDNLFATRLGLLRLVPRSGCNWVLTHWGVFPCTIHIDALVPRRSITAGVPGPRRNADDRDAGWFAPVATRRRPMLGACGASPGARSIFPGGRPPGPPGWPHVGGGSRRWPLLGWGSSWGSCHGWGLSLGFSSWGFFWVGFSRGVGF
jgi:hypothetical protein